MSIARFHAEWLNLLEIDGPFVTLPVLTERLRSGLEPTDADLVAELRTARSEVEDDPTLHPVWTRWVVTRLLGFPDEVLRDGAGIGPRLTHRVVEHGETLRPDFAVVDQGDDGEDKGRILINIWPAGTDLAQRPAGERWAASPIDRIAELCRATTVRLGLVTNGDTWTLVDAPVDGTTGTATWDATLWAEERTTLDAFTTLLGVRRFFTVAEDETLEALLMQSANAEAEVTDQLGKQVRAAVELLVDAMSRADRERNGSVFRELAEAELDRDLEPYIYEAAVTVLMRLVFLLSAEERGLFLLGDPTYDATYAVSTLLGQLDEESNRYGEDVLERRTDAWHRLLATFRMVHAGAAHANLRLPPYGGSLFDPDRFPFLEGRHADLRDDDGATPLRIDNRTVKHILDALQVLRFRGRGGWQEARRLSFRSLGVEQIGHVYEGLLDHGVVQVTTEAVALTGKNDPEVALELIEAAASKGRDPLVSWLAELTGDKPKTIEKTLDATPEPEHFDRLASACDNDPELAARIAPYLGLIRTDLRGLPQVYLPDSYYVTKSSDRRSSGAYYTPRALAEEMVTHTLEPLVFRPGPAEGAEPEQWTLKGSLELLDLRVCDMAMGSGAFLVAACRYLADRLLEAWDVEAFAPGAPIVLPSGLGTPMPDDETDREVLARRLVADRCLYGVDRNPMAVEMAKLSLWLITLAKDRPFTFVDHALRCGDSLLGVTSLRQLDSFHLDPAKGRLLNGGSLFDPATRIEPLVQEALEKRRHLESFTVFDITDAEAKRHLLNESHLLLDDLKVVADLVVGAALATATVAADAYDSRLLSIAPEVATALDPDRSEDDRAARLYDLRLRATYWLDEGRPPMSPSRRCLHWPLEFPEVFSGEASRGFDAVIGNPPFMGGTIISGPFGSDYRQYLAKFVAGIRTNRADLVAFFFLRAAQIAQRIGLLATQTISQADTREAGLDRLTVNEWEIYRAEKSIPWPGAANLSISKVWMTAAEWRGRRFLDGLEVGRISSALERVRRVSGAPQSLASNVGQSLLGAKPAAAGFVITADEAMRLLEDDPKNAEVVRPYISGDDLTSNPDLTTSRWTVYFGAMPAEEASAYLACFDLVRERVKPQRDRLPDSKRRLRETWWRFEHPAMNFFSSVADEPQWLVVASVAKYPLPVYIDAGQIVNNKVVGFTDVGLEKFGVLNSSIHQTWVLSHGGKHETRPVYEPASCYETFPFAAHSGDVEGAATAVNDLRRSVMRERREGLTKVYNRFHDPGETSTDIQKLRHAHNELDHAVRRSYGWDALDLDHGFHETRQGVRYTLGPQAQGIILEFLLELNLGRHADEVASGLARGSKRNSRKRGSAADQPLF